MVPVRLLHHQGKTRQVHLHVQHQSDVTIRHQKTGATSPKTQNNQKRQITLEPRESVYETFHNGQRSSQMIPKMQKHLQSQKFSRDSDPERLTKVAPRKHSIYVHFPKDRNWEVCLRTKMIRALCRRRTGEVVIRAEKFSLMTCNSTSQGPQ